MNWGIKTEGAKILLEKLQKLPENTDRKLSKAVFIVAGKIEGICDAKYIPVEDNVLRASGRVKSITVTSAPAAEITYSAAHALVVHENLEAAHGAVFNAKYAAKIAAGKPGFKGGRGPQQQAKYLERAVDENIPLLADDVITVMGRLDL